MKVKACPYCETTITTDKSSGISESCQIEYLTKYLTMQTPKIQFTTKS